jgi:hypothetical protein
LDTASVVYHNPKKVVLYSYAERAEKLSLFPLSSSLICGTAQSKQNGGFLIIIGIKAVTPIWEIFIPTAVGGGNKWGRS